MKTYANETMKLLYERASCRSFLDKDIPEDVLNDILDAGLHAATGGNLQPYSIIKITDPETKKRLSEDCDMQPIVERAPVNLLFCIDWRRTKRWAEACNAPFIATKSYRHFWIAFQDTIICAQNICTAADALGLGSVYIGTVESCFRELQTIFDIPEGVFPVVLLSLGYPTKYPEPAKKLGVDQMVHDEKYQDSDIDDLLKAQDEKYNHKTIPASEKNLSEIYDVAKDIGDDTYAQEMIRSIKDVGHINMAQRYFGLHYQANWAAKGNGDFLDTLRHYGFEWITGTDF